MHDKNISDARVASECFGNEQLAASGSAADDRMLSIVELPAEDQQNIRDIIAGKIIPPLYADTIAKRLFNPDVHADRLNFLMRSIAKDETIDVVSSAGNENYRQSLHSKGMISDIPSWLRDGRFSDLEMQKVKQDFIFTRVELYASDMLLLQYSVREGQAKGDLNYSNVNEALMIILMVESPEAFQNFDKKSEKYIHRFTQMTADTGLSYPTKAKMMYVQLDKCLKQFKEGRNAEAEDGKPDGLQLWLSMIADVNDGKVSEAAERDGELAKMRIEARNMAQDKEVQNMLIQEKYDRMDWLTYGNDREARGKILGTIETMRDDGRSDKEIVERLVAKYGMNQAQAEEVVGLQPA